MVSPLWRRSGRKSSQVRNICFSLRAWKIVVSENLGNPRRSRVVTRSSLCISQQSLKVWTIWKPHLQIQKENWEYQRKVGNLSGFQDQSKVARIKRARYAIGNVSKKDLLKIIKYFEKIGKVPYVKGIPKHEPTSSYFHLVKATCEVYDEIWWTQSSRTRQLCGRDC